MNKIQVVEAIKGSFNKGSSSIEILFVLNDGKPRRIITNMAALLRMVRNRNLNIYSMYDHDTGILMSMDDNFHNNAVFYYDLEIN